MKIIKKLALVAISSLLLVNGNAQVNQTPVVRYSFDNDSGNNYAADSGLTPPANGYYYSNNLPSPPISLINDTPNGAGYALNLVGTNNGTNNYIDGGDTTKLHNVTNLTLTCWINLRGDANVLDRIVDKIGYNGLNGFGWAFESGAASNLTFRFFNNTFISIPGAINADKKWVFVALTYAGSGATNNLNLYRGDIGTPVVWVGGTTYATLSGIVDVPQSLRVGSAKAATDRNPPDDRTPPAWFDDVRIYTSALSPEQLETIRQYTAGALFASVWPPATNVYAGATVSLIASPTSDSLSYQWYFNGTNIDNGTNSTLTISTIQQPLFGNYYVVVTNVFSSVTSSIATIYEPTTIITQPSNQVVPYQSSATFSVSAVGYPSPTYYQWSLNGTNITGANTNTLTIPSVTLNNTGNYRVAVSNLISTTNSQTATLNISPSITSPFIGATPIWGRNVSLSVGVVGNGTLTYQWYFNGEPIDGAVLPQLNFSSIQFTNQGFYYVVISSLYGSVTNVAAEVSVNPSIVTLSFSPTLTIQGAAGNSYIIRSSANLSDTNNWNTLTNLTLTQPVQIWVDTSVDASSPFYNKYFYHLIPQ